MEHRLLDSPNYHFQIVAGGISPHGKSPCFLDSPGYHLLYLGRRWISEQVFAVVEALALRTGSDWVPVR